MAASERAESGSTSGKVSSAFVAGGVAVAKTSGMVAGYSSRFLKGLKEKGANLSMQVVPSDWGKGLFTGGLLRREGGETAAVKINIAKAKEKIDKIYYEIGKQGAGLSGVENINDHESVKLLIEEVRGLTDKVRHWETRLKEIEKEQGAARKRKKKYQKISISDDREETQIRDNGKSLLEKSLRSAVFENESQKAIFEKVSRDLFDDDVEIRILAAAELGKMGNAAAVPVLEEAINFDSIYLTSEVINALININDSGAVPVFKKYADHKNYRIRLGSLRGMYKLAGGEAVKFLIDSLKDEHSEVRKSSATFLGWAGTTDAVPALIHILNDPDEAVKKASVMALSTLRDPSSVMPMIRVLGECDPEVREKIVHAIERISGKSVEFDTNAGGDELKAGIDALKEWWQKNKSTDVEEVLGGSAAELPEEPEQVSVEPAEPDVGGEAPAGQESEVLPEQAAAAGGDNEPDVQASAETETSEEYAKESEGLEEAARTDLSSTGSDGEDSAEAVSEPEDVGVQDEVFTESYLFSLLKKDLAEKCKGLDIAFSADETKSELVRKILEKCGN